MILFHLPTPWRSHRNRHRPMQTTPEHPVRHARKPAPAPIAQLARPPEGGSFQMPIAPRLHHLLHSELDHLRWDGQIRWADGRNAEGSASLVGLLFQRNGGAPRVGGFLSQIHGYSSRSADCLSVVYVVHALSIVHWCPLVWS